MRHFLIVAFIALVSAGSSPTARAESGCKGGRHIFLIDRTSELNRPELEAFRDGVTVLFQNAEFYGEIELAELRGSALSYEWIYGSCIQGQFVPPPACLEYFEAINGAGPNEEVNRSIWSDPLGWLSGLFGDSEIQFDESLIVDCQREHNKFLENREFEKSRVVQAIIEKGREAVESTETALTESLFRILSSRCKKLSCKLYVFSNLLDDNWRRKIKQGHGLIKLGAESARNAKLFDPKEVKVETVVAWGFGFDETDGDDKIVLSGSTREKLIDYWKGFFGEIADGSVEIDFEIPR